MTAGPNNLPRVVQSKKVPWMEGFSNKGQAEQVDLIIQCLSLATEERDAILNRYVTDQHLTNLARRSQAIGRFAKEQGLKLSPGAEYRRIYGRQESTDPWSRTTGYSNPETLEMDDLLGSPREVTIEAVNPALSVETETEASASRILAILADGQLIDLTRRVPTARLRELKPELLGRDTRLDAIIQTL